MAVRKFSSWTLNLFLYVELLVENVAKWDDLVNIPKLQTSGFAHRRTPIILAINSMLSVG